MKRTANIAFNDEDDDTKVRNEDHSMTTLFNSEDYSDCRVLFTKSNTTLHLHKAVLCPQSDYFRACFASGMKEANENIIEIEPEEDEEHLTMLIRSLYTMEIDAKPEDIVPLILLAEKYQATKWIKLLEQHLCMNIIQENFLDCLELNFSTYDEVETAFASFIDFNRDTVLLDNTYLRLSLDQFMILVQHYTTNEYWRFALEMIFSWVNANKEERFEYYDVLVKHLHNVCKPPVIFNPEYCSNNAKITRQVIATKTATMKRYNCLIFGTKIHSFKIKITRNCNGIRIGFATLTKTLDNLDAIQGYFLRCNDGNLVQNIKGEAQVRPFAKNFVTDGSTLRFTLKQETIYIFIDDEFQGAAFRDVTEDLYPLVCMYEPDCQVELIK